MALSLQAIFQHLCLNSLLADLTLNFACLDLSRLVPFVHKLTMNSLFSLLFQQLRELCEARLTLQIETASGK